MTLLSLKMELKFYFLDIDVFIRYILGIAWDHKYPTEGFGVLFSLWIQTTVDAHYHMLTLRSAGEATFHIRTVEGIPRAGLSWSSFEIVK